VELRSGLWLGFRLRVYRVRGLGLELGFVIVRVGVIVRSGLGLGLGFGFGLGLDLLLDFLELLDLCRSLPLLLRQDKTK
jgi:hypothetical protein